MKEGNSYKRPDPFRHLIKKKKEKTDFCEQFWKEFCDFFEKFTRQTIFVILSFY